MVQLDDVRNDIRLVGLATVLGSAAPVVSSALFAILSANFACVELAEFICSSQGEKDCLENGWLRQANYYGIPMGEMVCSPRDRNLCNTYHIAMNATTPAGEQSLKGRSIEWIAQCFYEITPICFEKKLTESDIQKASIFFGVVAASILIAGRIFLHIRH
jgi:hypothetical protein